MNPIQTKLLELADTIDLGGATAYGLAKKIGVNHPYKVQFAIDQLVKKGWLVRNRQTGSIVKANIPLNDNLISIPYYGEVNCGEALVFADNIVKGYLKVSPSVLSTTKFDNLFALKAVGSSMNSASINKKAVKDSDYVIAQRNNGRDIRNGDYVISIIGGAANLKQFYKDDTHRRILLLSNSSDDHPPIIISQEDADDISAYEIIAKAVDVIPGTQSPYARVMGH